jgi:phenylacetate-CoA ligase
MASKPETLFVEILDENNKAVLNGTSASSLLLIQQSTSIYTIRHWRYWILDEKSTLQNRFSKIIGRTNDVPFYPGKKSPGLTFYYVTKSIIEDDGNVKEFIIKQKLIL